MTVKKTNNHFVISNYKHDPTHLLKYCQNYTIYEQTPRDQLNYSTEGLNLVFSQHSGHNISDYFRFFIDHYENLPERMALIKGNVFPRHLTQEYFERVYDNQSYTFLFHDASLFGRTSESWSLLSESEFTEINTPWYVDSNPHWYFRSINSLLSFIFKNPVLPEKILFSPGACYIVTREQVVKYPKVFYQNLMKIITYTNPVNPFPSEAHQVERLMHTLFTTSYSVSEHMCDESLFDDVINSIQPKLSQFLLKEASQLKSFSDMRVLELGAHDAKRLHDWSKVFKAQCDVVGIGPGHLSEELSRLRLLNEKFHLAVYEGYFFAGEVELVVSALSELIHEGGSAYLFDLPKDHFLSMKRVITAFQKSNCPVVVSLGSLADAEASGGARAYLKISFLASNMGAGTFATISNYFQLFKKRVALKLTKFGIE